MPNMHYYIHKVSEKGQGSVGSGLYSDFGFWTNCRGGYIYIFFFIFGFRHKVPTADALVK